MKAIKDPLGVSPTKGNQGTTRGKEKILFSDHSGNRTHKLRIRSTVTLRTEYEVGQRKSGTIKVVNRGEEKVSVHMNVVPRSIKNTIGGTEN